MVEPLKQLKQWIRTDSPFTGRQGKPWFWKGCKPNSVCALRRRESFVLATNTRNPSAFAEMERAAPGFPIWPCTRWGLPCRVACTSRGALLPHLFTLTASNGRRRSDFLWHFPSANLPACRPRVSRPTKPGLRGIALYSVRTFLPRLARGSDSPPFQNRSNTSRTWRISQVTSRGDQPSPGPLWNSFANNKKSPLNHSYNN